MVAAEGHLTAAIHAARCGRGPRAGALVRLLRGEVQVLRHELLDEVLATPASPRRRVESGRRRVLHVVSNALPGTQAGYTIRTHGIATAQRDAGVETHVVARRGFPVDSGALAPHLDVSVEGIPRHRLVPRGWLPLPGRGISSFGPTS